MFRASFNHMVGWWGESRRVIQPVWVIGGVAYEESRIDFSHTPCQIPRVLRFRFYPAEGRDGRQSSQTTLPCVLEDRSALLGRGSTLCNRCILMQKC